MVNPFSPSCPDVALYEFCVSWILSRMFAECLSSRLSYCRYLTKRARCAPSWGSERDVSLKQQDSKKGLIMGPLH